MIRISQYKLSREVDSFIDWLDEKHIIYFVQRGLKWIPVGDMADKHKTSDLLKDEYNLCFEGLNCKTLMKGKIFNCTFSSRLYDIGIVDNCEYLEILTDKEISWTKIYNFWTENISRACNFCNMMNPNAKLIECAVQVNTK